jgi:hypothetical protein
MATLEQVLLMYEEHNIPLPRRELFETQQEWLRKALKHLEEMI